MASQKTKAQGFSIIELLIVIAVIGILTTLVLGASLVSRDRAEDNTVRGDVRQLRIIAESVYDTQGASYLNWSQHPVAVSDVAVLKVDIDKAAGGVNAATILESQRKEFCISAPLRSKPLHFCTDATGVSVEQASPCQAPADEDEPLRCLTN